MLKTRVSLLFFLFLITSSMLNAQQMVVVQNYTNDHFSNSRQHWSAIQDDYGKMVFGNSNAITMFDGVNWQYIHVPKGATVYSLDKSNNGTIYTGGEGDIGYLYADDLYQLQFESLLDKLNDAYHNFLYVRQTHYLNGNVYFRSSEQMMMYDEVKDSVFVLSSEFTFGNSFKIDDKIYVQLLGMGLYDVTDFTLKKVPISDEFKDDAIYGIVSIKNHFLIYSRKNGLQLWKNNELTALKSEANSYLSSHKGYRMVQLQSGIIAIATLTGGIVFIDEEGNLIQILNEESGLNNNSVYGLYQDRNNLLWAVLDDGISVIKEYNNYQKFDDLSGVDGLVSSVFELHNNLYYASNSGVYQAKSNNPLHFSKIIDLPSQSYKAINIENKIINATFDGLYEIIENRVNKISTTIYEELLQISNYEFLGWSKRQIFKLSYKNEEISEVLIIADIDKPKDWVELKESVFIVTVSSELHSLNLQNPETERNPITIVNESLYSIETFDGEILVGGSKGIYTFNNSTNRIALLEDLSELKQVTLLQECNENIWLRSSATSYKVTRTENNLSYTYKKFNDIGETGGVFGINCINDNIWFGLEKKIVAINRDYKNPQFNFSTNITRFSIGDDSLLYAGFTPINQKLALNFSRDKIRFNFASTNFYKPEFNQYQYKMQGFDAKWSEWTLETQKDYTNIPEGAYSFEVKSRNLLGDESDIASFPFTILPPWYRTWWAYTLYFITIVALLYLAYRVRINQVLRVQNVRNRIADDLHDDLSGTLIGISNFAKAISKNPNLETQSRFIGLIEKSADEAKEKISDIVWSINPAHDDWITFLAKCRRYASDIFESNGIEYELNLDQTFKGDLEMEIRKNLWLIYKEIISNIIKHADASFVNVTVNFSGNNYYLEVRDNGKSFDLATISGDGNGLKTVNKRVELLKGEVKLEPILNVGTIWKIMIPL